MNKNLEQREAVIVVGPSFPVARTRSSEGRQCSYSVNFSTICMAHAKNKELGSEAVQLQCEPQHSLRVTR